MSCWAIAYWTRPSSRRRAFCGSVKLATSPAAFASLGKSSAGSVCRLKRLRPAFSVLRQRPQDIQQLACTHRKRACLAAGAEAAARADLDLDVRGQESQRVGRAVDQHVGEDRERVPALDDSAHRSQGRQKLVALCFDHCWLSIYLVVANRARAFAGQLAKPLCLQRFVACRARGASCGWPVMPWGQFAAALRAADLFTNCAPAAHSLFHGLNP